MLYGIFLLVGRATVGIFCRQLDSRETQAISSVVGLSILTLLSTYLVLLGIPLAEVSKSIALGIIVLSIIALFLQKHPTFENLSLSAWLNTHIPFLVTVLLLLLPFSIGGYEFAILRGNGTDSFNYVDMADALSHFSLDWILQQPKEVLAAYSPNLPLAQDLLQTRWSTSALLAFGSNTFGISPVAFEFTFTLTLMLVLYDALVAALSATSTLFGWTKWLPVIFVTGFWGQFILDIRAFSQMASMPILVLLVGWLLSPSNFLERFFRYGPFLTAILAAALSFQYPEIIIPFLPGLGLIVLIRMVGSLRECKLKRWEIAKSLIVFCLMTPLLLLPIIKFLFVFIFSQTHFAIGKSPGWEWAYFTWMIKNPIGGLWGLGGKPELGTFVDNVDFDISLVTSIGLFCVGIVRFFSTFSFRARFRENQSEAFLYILAATGFLGASFLVARGNVWAAGKVLTYFSILIPIWLGNCLQRDNYGSTSSRLHKIMSRILIGSTYVFFALNFFFAGARIIHAERGSELSSYYIAQHGEHRRVDASAIAGTPDLDCPIGSRVAVFEPTDWEREFLTHLLDGKGFPSLTPGNPPTRSSYAVPYRFSNNLSCVFAQRNYFDSSRTSFKPAGLNRFVFKNPGNSFVALLTMSGGYGVERNPNSGTRFIWMGLEQSVLLTIGARNTDYSVNMALCPGVPRGNGNPITILVDVDSQNISEYKVNICKNITIYLKKQDTHAIQKIKITMKDPSPGIRLKGPDTRDLRLKVEVLKIRMTEEAR